MGSWNQTCMISNLHITAGTDVVIFLLAENRNKKTFCYGNAMYDVCPIPFYGKYNDYGAAEECYGVGLPVVMDELKRQLYEFGQGPNEFHDPIVKKGIFNIDVLFDADHEDRLGIEYFNSWNEDDYDIRELEKMRDDKGLTADQQFELDRLAAKITKVDTFRRVTHVQIHKKVFDDIMEKWYIEDYVGEGKGSAGYNKSYNYTYFKDVIATLPAYVAKLKETYRETDDPALKAMRRFSGRNMFDWKDPCTAGRFMNAFSSSSESRSFCIVRVHEHICDLAEDGKWDEIAEFAKEALIGYWVDMFMSCTRKAWVQTTGKGGQIQEPLGYTILAHSVLDILAAEKAEYGDDEEDEE